MKNIAFVILFVLGKSFGSFAQDFSLAKNSKLYYQVKTKTGSTYPFNIKIEQFGSGGIKFSWIIREDNKGVVTIYKSALDNARVYKNYFSNGSNSKLTKESTVWMSKVNFEEITKSNETSLALDFTVQKFKKQGTQKFSTTSKGKKIQLDCLVIVSSDSENKLLVVNDSTNPLIVQMKVKDFEIGLLKVE